MSISFNQPLYDAIKHLRIVAPEAWETFRKELGLLAIKEQDRALDAGTVGALGYAKAVRDIWRSIEAATLNLRLVAVPGFGGPSLGQTVAVEEDDPLSAGKVFQPGAAGAAGRGKS